MKVSDVMVKKPITGTPQMRLYQALAVMVERKIRHLLIVDGDELVGMLSDRDVKRHMSAAYQTSEESPEDRATMLKTCGEVMTRDPIAVTPTTPLAEVVQLMIDRKFGGVPVVDDARRPVGIVTSIDLLRLLLPHV